MIFYPRPPQQINNPHYARLFRDLAVITSCNNFSNKPIPQLYEPANPHHIHHDHAFYTMESLEKLFFKQECIATIDDTQQVKIETATRGQSTKKPTHFGSLIDARGFSLCLVEYVGSQQPPTWIILQKQLTRQ